jgi:hypothetical protein
MNSRRGDYALLYGKENENNYINLSRGCSFNCSHVLRIRNGHEIGEDPTKEHPLVL